jgi:hypothetical protein
MAKKMKLNLEDLKVKSFTTANIIDNLRGGLFTEDRKTGCIDQFDIK